MDTSDVNRRIENMILHGSIMAVDTAAYRVRVQAGNLQTEWLPWFVQCAGEDRDWRAPSIGEQAFVFCPSGEPTVGFVLCGIFSSAFAPPSTDGEVQMKHYKDNTIIQYNRQTHLLNATFCDGTVIKYDAEGNALNLSFCDGTVVNYDAAGSALNATLASGGTVYLEADGGVTVLADVDITGDVTITGDVAVTGEISATGQITSMIDVIAAGISLVHHVHDNTQPASSGNYSGAPV